MTTWPAGWPRTESHKRRRGEFAYWGSEKTYTPPGEQQRFTKVKRDLTRAMGVTRVQDEVRILRATDLRIDTFEDLRLDGAPRSQQPRDLDPGAVVSFRLPGGKPIVIPCDRYTSIAQNLGAIAATLEAKRTVERHGVGTLEREFEGYKALPPGGTAVEGYAPQRSPWDVLGVLPGTTVDTCEVIYKAKARGAHPDAGGSHEAMVELNEAIDAIRGGRA